MAQDHIAILSAPAVRTALRQAWEDSLPGIAGGHEEGGFILQDSVGNLSVARWPKGAQTSILLPLHSQGRVGEADIIATFHTHPNTGSDFLQEPGETDQRAVRDDPDLKGDRYTGEFVISQSRLYFITPVGQVTDLGAREARLG